MADRTLLDERRPTGAPATAALAGAPWRRAAAMGDSLVAGVGDPVPGVEHRFWVDRTFDALRDVRPGLATRNVGMRDALLADIAREQLPEVLAFDPDLVIVNGGGNDMLRPGFDAGATSAAFRAMVGALADGTRTVVLFTMLEIAGLLQLPEPWGSRLAERNATVQAIVRDTARGHGCLLIDFGVDGRALTRDMLSADAIHLNARGHAFAARIAIASLARQRARWVRPAA